MLISIKNDFDITIYVYFTASLDSRAHFSTAMFKFISSNN